MSQSTPLTTPSRRRAPASAVSTPASVARSTTSATSHTTLIDRIEELDLEIHDLRRLITLERSRLRPTSTASTTTASSTLSLSFLDPSGRSAVELRQVLAEKLAELDDDALAALLTASSMALSKLAGGETAILGVGRELIPSKSVGVEGVGSGSDLDRRLAIQADGVAAVKHAMQINTWLKDRQRRLTALVESLGVFSLLDIDTLSTDNRDGARRSVRIAGSVASLFTVDIRFDVDGEVSPQVRDLQVQLPDWLTRTLNEPHRLFSKLLARNDLPALLLMLRTMIPLISLRRNLFSSLMETYTHLARDHVRNWESSHGVDFTPYHPPSSTTTATARRANAKVDQALAKSLIDREASEVFTLTNKRGASLELRFAIRWNRYGHAYPDISAVPNVPASLTDGTARAFLAGFGDEFQHLLRVALAQNGIVALPDHDAEQDDELDPIVGRWGIGPAIHATVKAFFGLQQEDEQEEGSSVEQE